MPWYVLLIIALASIALVAAVLVRVGLTAWRVVKHAGAVSGRVTPLVDGLSRRADEAAVAAERLSRNGEEISRNVARIQRSVARLQVIVNAINDALRPYWLISGWLSGEREWNGLGFF